MLFWDVAACLHFRVQRLQLSSVASLDIILTTGCSSCRWRRQFPAVMENLSLSSDVRNDVTTYPSPHGNFTYLVFKVIYSIIGIVGVVDNLFVLIIFILFIKITDKVYLIFSIIVTYDVAKLTGDRQHVVRESMTHTRGVQKVLQVDMLDWKTFHNLYTNKTHVFF